MTVNELCAGLVRYGIDLLKKGLAQPPTSWPKGKIAELVRSMSVSGEVLVRLERARGIIGDGGDDVHHAAPGGLRSIFCAVRDRLERLLEPYYVAPRRLSLDLSSPQGEERETLWQSFCDEIDLVPEGQGVFETFCALLQKYGSYVPGTTAADDISVFEQFKGVAALAWCLPERSVDEVLLVAGDIPGIQRMLYAITSKGAAKSLRGRSFYLQLLNDAVVRVILRELRLPWVCVISHAGGNFKLLARGADEQNVEVLYKELTRRMLTLHNGELSVALAWTRVAAEDIVEAYAFSQAMHTLNEHLQRSRAQAFAPVATGQYERLLGIHGSGSRLRCGICQVELVGEDAQPEDVAAVCRQCRSFENLAQQIAEIQECPWLAIAETTASIETLPLPTLEPPGKPGWEDVMAALGVRYALGKEATGGVWTALYRLNGTEAFIPSAGTADCQYGFRFLANVTPRVRAGENLERLRSCLPDEEERERLRPGQIRDTTIMAQRDATGIHRYGVLRMDVDDLGTILAARFANSDMLHVSALSAALSLFFEGWLNKLCSAVGADWRQEVGALTGDKEGVERDKTPYLIYAGGDDLLVVGPWDLLPHLAWRICGDLTSYVRQGYVSRSAEVEPGAVRPLTLSAGIYADSDKFPLYRAADLAGSALGSAKRRRTHERLHGETRVVKDAISWLDVTLGWGDFGQAKGLALKLASLIKVGKNGRQAPRSLLWLLHDVAQSYQQTYRKARATQIPDDIVAGRWAWKLAYGLNRLVQRLEREDPELAREVLSIAGDTLDLTRAPDSMQWRTIQFLGLPVRWAELLIREEG